MMNKYFAGSIPTAPTSKSDLDKALESYVLEKVNAVEENMDNLHISNSLSEIWAIIARSNKYIDETAPWVLAKSEEEKDKQALASVMYHLAENLRIVAILIKPFMQDTSKKMLEQLGIQQENIQTWDSTKTYGQIPTDVKVVEKGEPLFMRLDVEEETNYIREGMKG